MDKNDDKMLEKMEDKVKWFCPRCTDAVESIKKENKELKQVNNQLTSR